MFISSPDSSEKLCRLEKIEIHIRLINKALSVKRKIRKIKKRKEIFFKDKKTTAIIKIKTRKV
jgi:hypothetical protein